MKPENIFQKIAWTEDQRRQHLEIRERFQREKPSRAELQRQGDLVEYETLGEYLDSLAAASLLKSLREKAGLSVANMAQAIGSDEQAVQAIERGPWSPAVQLDALYKYARAVGADLRFSIQTRATAGG